MVFPVTYLREGKQSDALDVMELYWDGALITFVAYGDTVPQSKRADYVVRAARVARDYRAAHPWTNREPSVAEGVQKAFRLAD